MPMAPSHAGGEMYQKGHVQPVFRQPQRPLSRASELYETEFEEDEMSDFEEYNGRTSEDSVGRSDRKSTDLSNVILTVWEPK